MKCFSAVEPGVYSTQTGMRTSQQVTKQERVDALRFQLDHCETLGRYFYGMSVAEARAVITPLGYSVYVACVNGENQPRPDMGIWNVYRRGCWWLELVKGRVVDVLGSVCDERDTEPASWR